MGQTLKPQNPQCRTLTEGDNNITGREAALAPILPSGALLFYLLFAHALESCALLRKKLQNETTLAMERVGSLVRPDRTSRRQSLWYREPAEVDCGQAIVGPLPDAALQPPGQLGFRVVLLWGILGLGFMACMWFDRAWLGLVLS